MADNKFMSEKNIVKMLVLSSLGLFSINILKAMSIFTINADMLNNFSSIFISMILEGFPFIILGTLVSSLIQIYISEETILKLIPENKLLGIFFASFIGIIFPVCDCAIIPVTRRLIKKGVPVGMAVTFMLSVPIINPIVLMSTYYAFLGKPYMVFSRIIFGLSASIIIGYLISILSEDNPLRDNLSYIDDEACCCHGHAEHDHEHKHEHFHEENKLSMIIHHTSAEIYDTGKFFIIGALLSAFMQTFIPRKYLISIGQGNLYSVIVMLALAYILSVCSQTDAFIARSFLGQFTAGSVIGFLIFSPMLDIKNTIMLIGNFKWKFTIKLVLLIISVCFIMAISANYLLPAYMKLAGGALK